MEIKGRKKDNLRCNIIKLYRKLREIIFYRFHLLFFSPYLSSLYLTPPPPPPPHKHIHTNLHRSLLTPLFLSLSFLCFLSFLSFFSAFPRFCLPIILVSSSSSFFPSYCKCLSEASSRIISTDLDSLLARLSLLEATDLSDAIDVIEASIPGAARVSVCGRMATLIKLTALSYVLKY